MADQNAHDVKRPNVMLAGDVRWGFAWGLVLVLVGVALLLDHLGLSPVANITKYWPLLLVLLGLMNITSHGARGFGLILICAGILLQLDLLGLIHLTFQDFWPLAIIAVGVLLIWGSIETRRFGMKKPKVEWFKPGAGEDFRQQAAASTADPDTIYAVAIFGGCIRKYSGQHFRGGKAVSIFGGVELDFREANLDDEAVLEINCIFGGVEIRVPDNWHVHSRSLPVLGGFEDKTRERIVIDPSGASNRKTLIVTGTVVFGGVEVKN